MEKTNILTLVLVLTVGVILAGSLLEPIVNDATTTEKTFTNVGRYYVSTEVDDDVTITMDYDIDGSTRTWYIDDEQLIYEPTTTGPEYAQVTTVVGADNLLFRTDGRARGLASTTGSNDYSLTVTNENITYGGVVSHAPLFVASTKPTDYVLYNNINAPALIKGDSVLIACGYTGVIVSEAVDDTPAVSTNLVISFSGSVKDGFEITTFDSNYTFTVDNVVVNATAHEGYVDLYDFTSVEFDVISENDVATHCTYSVLAVPASVTAEYAQHLDGGSVALIKALPILVIIALVVAAVGAIAIKNRD